MSIVATRIGKILLSYQGKYSAEKALLYLDDLHQRRIQEPAYQKVLEFDPNTYARILSREAVNHAIDATLWSGAFTLAFGYAGYYFGEFPLAAVSVWTSYSGITSASMKNTLDRTITQYDHEITNKL